MAGMSATAGSLPPMNNHLKLWPLHHHFSKNHCTYKTKLNTQKQMLALKWLLQADEIFVDEVDIILPYPELSRANKSSLEYVFLAVRVLEGTRWYRYSIPEQEIIIAKSERCVTQSRSSRFLSIAPFCYLTWVKSEKVEDWFHFFDPQQQ